MNKQWYAEIQEVLYSKFVFKLHALLRGGKLKDISCSILPPKAFEYIRSMRFVFNVPVRTLSIASLSMAHRLAGSCFCLPTEPPVREGKCSNLLQWKYIDRGFGEDLIEQTQALLGRFSVLKSVAILFKHPEEETPTSSGVMTNGRCFYISPEKEPEVLETMLSLSRLFKDMNDISILVADSPEDLEWYANTRVPDEWEEEGLECENLAVSCAHIVHEEFKSERASSGCSIPRIYVGVEEHCPIWGVERWDGLGYVGYARWTTDFRISCLE